MAFKVYSYVQVGTDTPIRSLENICYSQLEAQIWVDKLNKAYSLADDLSKLSAYIQEEKKLFGESQGDLLSLEVSKTAHARSRTAFYIPETADEYIECLPMTLAMYGISVERKRIISELLKEYPEYLHGPYVL